MRLPWAINFFSVVSNSLGWRFLLSFKFRNIFFFNLFAVTTRPLRDLFPWREKRLAISVSGDDFLSEYPASGLCREVVNNCYSEV